jgi:hypothetical protein
LDVEQLQYHPPSGTLAGTFWSVFAQKAAQLAP